MLGDTIKGFRIFQRLGNGGMGEVWAAEQPHVKTKVAIKTLLAEWSSDENHVQRFFNEAIAVNKIKHAGITKIYDVGFHRGAAFLIMELHEGETLGARIRRTGGLSLAEVGDFGRQIASVLEATHIAKIVHRDLKPDNVFLVQDADVGSGERVKILDFGIAKLGSAVGLTRDAAMGTPSYMAPELWTGSGRADSRADVYALGCIAFEMCCGRPPFLVSTVHEAYGKHMFELAPRVRSLAPHVPKELDDTIARALEKQPSSRPSMREFQHVFSAVLGGHDLVPTVNGTPHEMPAKSPGRWRFVPAAGITLVVLVAATYLAAQYQTGTLLASRSSSQKISVTPGACPDGMVHIPATTFLMGSPANTGNDDERPEHPMSLSGYCIDRTEVTVAAYTKCVRAGMCTAAPEPGDDGVARLCNGTRLDRQNHPINCIDWYQAKSYCEFENRRLPSEAEWEYAARGRDRYTYPWGEDPPTPERLNACGSECRIAKGGLGTEGPMMYGDADPWSATAPVGSFPSGISPAGAFDMAGNVWEWMADDYLYYTPDGSRGRAPSNQKGLRRVLRGGACSSGDASQARGANRFMAEPEVKQIDIGLRCVRAD